MEIERKGMYNMMLVHFIMGVITILIKIYKPHYVTVSGLVKAFINRELLLVLFSSVIIGFILFSYILIILGLYLVGARTIGRAISYIQAVLSNCHLMRIEEYSDITNVDVGLIAAYIFLINPLMLSIIWPALVSIATIIMIIYIFSCISSK